MPPKKHSKLPYGRYVPSLTWQRRKRQNIESTSTQDDNIISEEKDNSSVFDELEESDLG